MADDLALVEFVDESLHLFRERGYVPSEFIRMRSQLTTVKAIERLVRAGQIQSGFFRLQELNVIDRSMEATVLKFRECFTNEARECAKFRLENINDPVLRAKSKHSR